MNDSKQYSRALYDFSAYILRRGTLVEFDESDMLSDKRRAETSSAESIVEAFVVECPHYALCSDSLLDILKARNSVT